MKQEFFHPFRWNLKEKRALKAMLEHTVSKNIPDAKIPRSLNQKAFEKAQKLVRQEREQLKLLISHLEHTQKLNSKFQAQMLMCCARILALGADYDLVFLGRSPESIFDFLSGICMESLDKDRLNLLQLSMRMYPAGIKNRRSHKELKSYFIATKLDPRSILERKRPVAFIDLVYSGATFYSIILFLKDWTEELGLDWIVVRKKIRFIGIVEQKKTSPKTVRWQQQSRFKGLFPASQVKNVSIQWGFWDFLGNNQHKSTESFTDELWGNENASSPTRNISTLVGLQSALFWFELGCTKEKRHEFSNLLVKQPEMKNESVRGIVISIRK